MLSLPLPYLVQVVKLFNDLIVLSMIINDELIVT